ncbi:MFS transporter [Pseudomonas putida]|uniref:MFS transporter n=1 Tax=Pseudomonas putida TaxID=303 RepID=UPI0027622C28|nr:MFS transporter [Pseudomonas putida]MDP9524585.1 MFS transporter [Pseudomonas putida]
MNSNSDSVLRAACILIAAASILAIGIQPIFIGLLVERLGLTLTQQSAVMSSEMCGSIFGTLACVPAMRRLCVRSVALLAAVALLLTNVLTAQVTDLSTLMALRAISGVGSGILYAYSIFGLGGLRDPDRSYGLLLLSQTALFAFSAATVPVIAGHLGFGWAINFISAWFALVCCACLYLPREQVARPRKQSDEKSKSMTLVGVFSLIGMVLLQLSIYSLWGFVEGIGGDAGITPVEIGWALSVGLLGGLPGAALPSFLGKRLGRAPMIFTGSLIVLVAIFMFATSIESALDLGIAVFLMNAGWNLALSYYMSSVVAHDPTGRLTRMVGSLQVISAATAPTLLMVLIADNERQNIYALSASSVLLGGLLMVLMLVISRMRKPVARMATD